jgi:hypothetical protein
VAAINGADMGCEDQAAVGVAMDKARDGHLFMLRKGIRFAPQGKPNFLKIGETLPADGIMIVLPVDKGKIIWCDR